MAVISILFAVAGSVWVGYLTAPYIQEHFFSDYRLHSTTMNLLLPVFVGMVQSVVFTLLPSVRYALFTVVDALREED